jgi:hypothetical protein
VSSRLSFVIRHRRTRAKVVSSNIVGPTRLKLRCYEDRSAASENPRDSVAENEVERPGCTRATIQ